MAGTGEAVGWVGLEVAEVLVWVMLVLVWSGGSIEQVEAGFDGVGGVLSVTLGVMVVPW